MRNNNIHTLSIWFKNNIKAFRKITECWAAEKETFWDLMSSHWNIAMWGGGKCGPWTQERFEAKNEAHRESGGGDGDRNFNIDCHTITRLDLLKFILRLKRWYILYEFDDLQCLGLNSGFTHAIQVLFYRIILLALYVQSFRNYYMVYGNGPTIGDWLHAWQRDYL